MTTDLLKYTTTRHVFVPFKYNLKDTHQSKKSLIKGDNVENCLLDLLSVYKSTCKTAVQVKVMDSF